MNRMKKVLSLILAAAMLLSLAAMITGCKENPSGNTDSTEPGQAGESGVYTVTIKTAGGMPMKGVAAYIYADSTKSDLKDYGETDDNGMVTFNLPTGVDYAIDLGVENGFIQEGETASESFIPDFLHEV